MQAVTSLQWLSFKSRLFYVFEFACHYFHFVKFVFSTLPLTATFSLKTFRNPSSGSIQISETGSLDRMKAQAERRKKVLDDTPNVTGRVENTRVNPDTTIDELLRNSKLDQLEEKQERKFENSYGSIRKISFFFSIWRIKTFHWTRRKGVAWKSRNNTAAWSIQARYGYAEIVARIPAAVYPPTLLLSFCSIRIMIYF